MQCKPNLSLRSLLFPSQIPEMKNRIEMRNFLTDSAFLKTSYSSAASAPTPAWNPCRRSTRGVGTWRRRSGRVTDRSRRAPHTAGHDPSPPSVPRRAVVVVIGPTLSCRLRHSRPQEKRLLGVALVRKRSLTTDGGFHNFGQGLSEWEERTAWWLLFTD